MTQKVIFTLGLPGSGKSTWSKTYCEKNKDWVRVNRDDLRNMRGKYWLPNQENLITDWEFYCIQSSLLRGYNVIVDSTNLNPIHREELERRLLSQCGHILQPFNITIKSFLDVPLLTCIKNDLKRSNSVGDRVIKGMYDKYIRKSEFESKKKYKPDTSKPKAVMFDIDGTLALMKDRSPFEWSKVGQDELSEEVARALVLYYDAGYNILILSGRDGICRKETEEWLNYYLPCSYNLWMREEGNTEKDAVIKERIFWNDIAPNFNVCCVYDDRNQVVEMWRNIGLKCFQVAEGDF
jgi:predicted kinase